MPVSGSHSVSLVSRGGDLVSFQVSSFILSGHVLNMKIRLGEVGLSMVMSGVLRS